MNWCEWFLAIIGATTLLLIGVVGVLLFWDWCLERFEVTHERSYYDGIEQARRELKSDANWFSECPITMKLLQDMATLRVDEARQNWRQARKDHPQ